MAIKFKLVKCNNLGSDQNLYPYKYYAREVCNEAVPYEELLQEIAEAGVPSSQVKAVLDRMSHLMRKHLSAGRIVQFTDFGNFRYCIGSPGFLSEEMFDVSQIRRPKIVFTPGKILRKAKVNVEFTEENLFEQEVKDMDD